MTRVITFVGNVTLLSKVIVKNKLTDVYVDQSYLYKVSDNGVKLPSTNEKAIFFKQDDINIQNLVSEGDGEITKGVGEKVRFHFVDTGIPPFKTSPSLMYSDGSDNEIVEMINRRVRIAKLISLIVNEIDDDLMFIDSDITVNNIDALLYSMSNRTKIGTLCIPAIAKPYNFVIMFCASTNFYLPREMRNDLLNVIQRYIASAKYVNTPVDIFINRELGSTPITWFGVCHHKYDKEWCI
ncbi:hypothetical protein [Deltalipothrixvirus pozzuoliense]|uniref:Uncharacterized protein ORF238 n=1 Tax=Acidianus filamentous virus 2 (isolate Italy/Pozzuoli) TaxID=654910 RepID=Y238_AFV2P|nr:hypothetical protein AFV2_gp32 [Acidianus filamentous virus 2]Q573D7.1 RecName: Full=Uncharacterized protein ORF238 [Acidianus filamentous virus 2 (isolate Pozzuoli)]CAH69419.1 hypothetical protein [Acidianus filamentous virus 2]